eukprot:1602324-Alexandrium_andersonii.AAC.1
MAPVAWSFISLADACVRWMVRLFVARRLGMHVEPRGIAAIAGSPSAVWFSGWLARGAAKGV